MAANLEQRVAILEEEVRRLRMQALRGMGIFSGQTVPDFLGQSSGLFADDPTFDEAVRLGREWREQDQPSDEEQKASKDYRQLVEDVLHPYAERRYANGDITNEAVSDRTGDHYLIVSVGWQGYRRVAHNLLHLDLIGGKVWIQKTARRTASQTNWKRRASPSMTSCWRSTAPKTAR